jgi:tripartite-type tricarboxylate transporter receptor subunit TctC
MATQPNVVSVNEKVAVKTLAELRTMEAKEKMAFSSPGSGTTPHLTCEKFIFILSGKMMRRISLIEVRGQPQLLW